MHTCYITLTSPLLLGWNLIQKHLWQRDWHVIISHHINIFLGFVLPEQAHAGSNSAGFNRSWMVTDWLSRAIKRWSASCILWFWQLTTLPCDLEFKTSVLKLDYSVICEYMSGSRDWYRNQAPNLKALRETSNSRNCSLLIKNISTDRRWVYG